MENNTQNKEFLQSAKWRKFQEAVGRKAHFIENVNFSASLIEHELPMVGRYLYCPRGPVTSPEGEEFPISNFQFPIKEGMQDLITLAKKENAGWIRIEPKNEELLKSIQENIDFKVVKAPHDMQPKEVFVIDISKSEDQLLAEMKSKTRYNIGIARKKGVKIFRINKSCHSELDSEYSEGNDGELNFGIPDQVRNDSTYYVDEFLRLTKEMAQRQGITAHPDEYYRKMIETLPDEMLRIYVAQFEGRIIASSLMMFFGETATYMHGASSNENRNVMAPFLLQWQAILDAKEKGCTHYDFGGISTNYESNTNIRITNKWVGITNFKLGFSPNTTPIVFAGTYDIIVNPRKYAVYRGLQRAKALLYKIRK